MSTQPPVVPARPSRSPQPPQQQQQAPPTSTPDAPKIPPRPNKRVEERSMSPFRHSYAPSPLNEKPGVSRTTSIEQEQRPPSVTIPSLGQEGIEYDDLNAGSYVENSHPQTPAETRNVGGDLKLHAPRPSLPSSNANAKVAAVTRTDSRQAAAAGIGGAASPETDESRERPSRSLHSKASDSRQELSTASSDRHQHYEDEHGIPEIGQRVPMDPNAGDVQAPSASPHPEYSQHRTHSSRETFLPPGSYGLHGHGVHNNDKFEKAWYEKHPDEYAKEEESQHTPALGTPRPEWALSSSDLNKLVRGSAVTGSGMGTSPAVTGTPEEELGYIASDEYTHRMASPAAERTTRPVVESPLRQMSQPTAETESKQEKASEDAGVIHVGDPYHSNQHPDGFAQSPALEKRTPGSEEEEAGEEPILAADEVRPESAFQHPAISPTFEKGDSFDHEPRSRPSSASRSRPNSRPTSLHERPGLTRFTSRDQDDIHTPLKDVAEYEPLFPEDDKDNEPVSTAERYKQRPDMLKHKFPSQDTWEDTPNSQQLHATVTTPDVPKQESFETPEEESVRRSQAASVDPHQVATHILESEDHKTDTKRPTLSAHRFPSRDVWEDAPDSTQLVTTVATPEEALENQEKSPELPQKPSIPSRPQRHPQPSPPVDVSTKPVTSPTEKPQPPSIPARPKPQIPARPAKRSPDEPKEAKDISAKPKPPVPGRPGGSRIAALKAGFLSDLNSRLQVGPKQPEKREEEPPAEKKPLQDARKGRARGPARRKPAPAPAPAPAHIATETSATKLPTIPEVKIAEPWNVWQVDQTGTLLVGEKVTSTDKGPSQPEVLPMAPESSKNVAGESTDPLPSPGSVDTPEVEKREPEPVKPEVLEREPDSAPTEPEPVPEPVTEFVDGKPEPKPTAEPDEEPAVVKQDETPVEGPSKSDAKREESEIHTDESSKPIGKQNDVAYSSDDSPASKTPTQVNVPKRPNEMTPESVLNQAAENLAASADGKRQSDGDIPVS